MAIYREDEFLRNAIKEIAIKYKITYFQAYDIYHSRFDLIKETISKLSIRNKVFPVAGVPHLGKFAVGLNRRKELLKDYQKWENKYKPNKKKNDTTEEGIKE